MAAIVLPTSSGIVTARVRLLDWGSTQRPVLGGPDTRVSRLGDRHALDVELPPMAAAEAMPWIQRLKRGKKDKVRMRVPQPGFTPAAIGASSEIFGAIAGGVSVVVDVHTAYTAKEGQFFSVIHAGISYLYAFDADTAAVSGRITCNVTPMLRTPLSNGDVCELINPIIEGYPEGDETGWDVGAAAHYGLAFTIVESE